MSKLARATCELLGHRAPTRFDGGAPYLRAVPGTVDGVGRQHVSLVGECARCGREFIVARMHATETGVALGLRHQQRGQLPPKEPQSTGPHSAQSPERANVYIWSAWSPYRDAAPPVPGDALVVAVLADGRSCGPLPAKLMNWGLPTDPEARIAWYAACSTEHHARARGSVDTDAQPIVPGVRNLGFSAE